MNLENPMALWGLLLIPLMLALFYLRHRARVAAIGKIGAATSLLIDAESETRRRWKSALWVVAYAAVVVALARPVWGVAAEIIETRGVAVMLVLDVSISMDAQDVPPSRLSRAKQAIQDVMRSAEGNLFGLIVFAGDAYVQFPLTSDIDSAMQFVSAASSRTVSRQGTAIESALSLALETFDERLSSDAIIVLLTDGENHEGDARAAAQKAAERGVTIHAIGYGTAEGDLIPVYDANGNLLEYKTDRASNLVTTALDAAILQEITEITGGLYQQATESGAEVVNLQNRIAEAESAVLTERFQTRPVERFGVFLLVALVSLTVEMILPERRLAAMQDKSQEADA